jgi:hypothetical protein
MRAGGIELAGLAPNARISNERRHGVRWGRHTRSLQERRNGWGPIVA